jgi:hypothetical protein
VGTLERVPAWATTGVGSLPFTDPERAAAHAVAAYDIPFCPQLPRLEGDMISEWLGADPRRCGWSPERDRERPRAWDALLSELAPRPPEHGLVKLQVTGPATLACALERERGGAPSRREALALATELASWLAANVAEQVRALGERGFDALLVVDEPALGVFGVRGVEAAWEPLRAVAPAWGLHLCCSVSWDLVERAEPDLLSFDLAVACIDRRAATALERLLARGTRLAWGVLAAHRPEHVLHGARRLSFVLARVPATGEQSLLTASCGTGRMAPRRESEVASALAAVAARRRAAPPDPPRRRVPGGVAALGRRAIRGP